MKRAQMMPSWVFSFPHWAATTYELGLWMIRIGCTRNLWWLRVVGRVVAFLGGVVLTGLYRIACTTYGKTA